MDTKLLINEYFGPTIQGEGKSVGKRALFIRTFSCNLHCIFCDTPYSWRTSEKLPHRFPTVYNKNEESEFISFEKLYTWIRDKNAPLLVITGGEPLLQRDKLISFLYNLIKPSVEIETAGTIDPDRLLDFPNVSFNVSPKLENSGNSKESRYKPDILKKFARHDASFKFVFTHPNDLEEIKQIVSECNIRNENIYIMFEGETQEKQLYMMNKYAELIIENKFNISPRLHSLIWGNKRGV